MGGAFGGGAGPVGGRGPGGWGNAHSGAGFGMMVAIMTNDRGDSYWGDKYRPFVPIGTAPGQLAALADAIVRGASIAHAEIADLRALIEAVEAHPEAQLAEIREDGRPTIDDPTRLVIHGGQIRVANCPNTEIGVSLGISAGFSTGAFFGDASFGSVASFGNACFAGMAHFGGARFVNDVSFSGAVFAQSAFFFRAIFAGRVLFSRACFASDVFLDTVSFAKDALFQKTQFMGSASFVDAQFAGDAYFHETTFASTASFVGAKFYSRTFS